MYYYFFSNLCAKLNADTASKLMAVIYDLTWITRPCNCRLSFNVDGGCIYGKKCRVAGVVYKATCKCCNQVYIGKSQRYWKTRIQEHFRDVWKMLERTRRPTEGNYPEPTNNFCSDTFDRLFSAHCSQLTNYRQFRKFVYENIKLDIIWKRSQISCNKSSQTKLFSLCLQEKKSIFHHVTKRWLFGSGNCKTRFCQFVRNNLGTEEGIAPETV